MQNIESIPSVLSIDELISGSDITSSAQDSLTVTSTQDISANNQQWQFCGFQLLWNCMFSWCDIVEGGGWVSEVSISVSKICRGANAQYFCLLFIDGLENAWVEYWSFSSRIDSNQKDQISIFYHFNLRVEQIVSSEMVGKCQIVVLSEFIVEAVQGIEEIFQCLYVFNALELSNSTGDIFTFNFVNPWSDHS